jgi:alkaline phosphatase D
MLEITHGPLVGATTDSSVNIWLRANGAAKVKIHLSTAADPLSDPKAKKAKASLDCQQDFTAVLSFTKLLPDTTYHYTVLLDGEPALDKKFTGQTTFHTFPKTGEEAGSFSFAFGSCFIPELHGDAIFNNLVHENGKLDPRFFLMIGDNIYADKYLELRSREPGPPPESLLELYRAAYRKSWGYPTFRQALMQTPGYMIFDDHEIWDNWNNSAEHQHDHEGFLAAKQAYLEYQDSHNPDAATRHAPDDPQYYYTFSYGKDVGFFVLDCRMRRNPQAIPYPTILGDEQRQALYKWLKDNKSEYRLKFIVSSVPINFVALPHTLVNLLHGTLGDQWLGYPEERLDLFKFIQYEGIEGVHFLSGDIHLGQALAIKPKEEKAGPTVYSYTSSPLANAFHLLPEQMPGWFSTTVWLLIGLLAGYLAARLLFDFSPGWGLLIGLLGGLVATWLWRKRQKRRGPQDKIQPGWIEKNLYIFFRKLTHLFYKRNLMGVGADTIEGAGVHYVPENLFTAVHQINMGIVTVDRTPENGTVTVQFKLVNAAGETLACEKDPHTV